jgi:type IV fimbrial biogenesis protein FimT
MNTIRHMTQQGFTLIELLVAIAVVAISITIAVPSLQDLLRSNRVASQNNELLALINLTKSQAIRRSEDWQVQLNSDEFGWDGEVRPRDGRALEADLDAGCPELRNVIRCSSFQGVQLTGETTLTFNNRGYVDRQDGGFGTVVLTLVHQGCTGNRQARRIEILPTGQVTSTAIGCPP